MFLQAANIFQTSHLLFRKPVPSLPSLQINGWRLRSPPIFFHTQAVYKPLYSIEEHRKEDRIPGIFVTGT